jgi:hypothetical protein
MTVGRGWHQNLGFEKGEGLVECVFQLFGGLFCYHRERLSDFIVPTLSTNEELLTCWGDMRECGRAGAGKRTSMFVLSFLGILRGLSGVQLRVFLLFGGRVTCLRLGAGDLRMPSSLLVLDVGRDRLLTRR